jgi:transglutaminase-like putative cysteine protease
MVAIVDHIGQNFRYSNRFEHGTQDPAHTLAVGFGSCRDFALLMIEAARSLGHPARFASGYLYDETDRDKLVGGRNTHAWVQIHLPGAGWVDFDPTPGNGLIGDRNLIPSCVTLDPRDAVPISGGFTGPKNAFKGMAVEVEFECRSVPAPSIAHRVEADACMAM